MTAVEDVVDVLEGKELNKWNSTDVFWSYNYDRDAQKASSEFYLDDADKVKCVDCYAYCDLEWSYDIDIASRTLNYLKIEAYGEAKLNVEILMEVAFHYEYEVTTPHIPIPYLAIDVFGFTFGFTVYGGVGIGVDIEMDYIWVRSFFFHFSFYENIKNR